MLFSFLCVPQTPNSMKLKKNQSGVLKHKILSEFEISEMKYYRFIVREHVLLLKNLPKLKFSFIIFCFDRFHPFSIKKSQNV